jgi:hypothetical protein
MSNLTLSIDDEILKQAKLKTVQEGISLSAKVRELLQRYATGQLDNVAPDLSFAENALLFTAQRKAEGAFAGDRALTRAPDQVSAPLAANGISVDPDYLRSIRGWAREDLYDQPSRHGK